MFTYLISYDLNSPKKDYESLFAAIMKYPTHWRYLDSNWLVETSDTAVQIWDKLTKELSANDQLFIARLSGEAAWLGFPESGTRWLKARLEK